MVGTGLVLDARTKILNDEALRHCGLRKVSSLLVYMHTTSYVS